MTTSIAHELEHRRRAGRPVRDKLTMLSDLSAGILAELERHARVRFPSPRFRADPVAFFREVIGVEPWHKQVEVLEAIRDHPRVAVRAGHKVSKSHTIAGIALWYYCSFVDARVVLTSTTARQVDQILWRELRMMRARSGRCVDCKAADPDGHRITRPCPHSAIIEGEQGELARTGLKSDDFREIVGFTAREAEAVAGISGQNLLYLPDEASGIDDAIFEAIEGNRAGGARIAMFSNPTRNEGEFYEAFFDKKDLYHTITISSEETPNVTEGSIVIPGLATREWIEEKKLEWGEDSSQYKIRVKGLHALHEQGKIFSVHTIAQAEQRWHDAPELGRLFVGLDPAGASGTGDESAFAARRGLKILELREHRGLTDDAHLVHLLALLQRLKIKREVPVVVIDREGSVGATLYGRLQAHLEAHPGAFELVAVRASDRAVRQPRIYDRMRDELTASFEQWIRDGGAIPEDTKLSAEMHKMEWKQSPSGRLKVTPKDQLKRELRRSPDRYDACALSVWEPLSLSGDDDLPPSARSIAQSERDEFAPALDPYEGAAAFHRR